MKFRSILTFTVLLGAVALTSACREKAAEEVKEAVEISETKLGVHEAGDHGHAHGGEMHEEGHAHGHGDVEENADADADADAPMAFDAKPAVGTKAKCPVMKHTFTVKEDSPTATYKGKTYVFCCPGCKPQFEENPEKFLN